MSTSTATPRKYETLAEAGARTGVSPRTLRRRIADGDLTGYRFGPRLLRVDAAEVDALLRAMPNARTAA